MMRTIMCAACHPTTLPHKAISSQKESTTVRQTNLVSERERERTTRTLQPPHDTPEAAISP